MMKWFGESWEAPINESVAQCKPPIGRTCITCGEPIIEGQQGILLPFGGGPQGPANVPYHIQCFLKSVSMNEPSWYSGVVE